MKVTKVFYGTVNDGILSINQRQSYEYFLSELGQSEVEILIRKRKKLRSLSQNALYWIYLNLIAEETAGTTEEEYVKKLHNAFKEKFIPSVEFNIFGITTKDYKTTTDMSPFEFSTYIKQIEELTSILCLSNEDTANFTVI